MAHKAPGKHFRRGLSFVQVSRMFPDDATAEAWFIKTRWPDGVHCLACGSVNIQERNTRKPQPYRCRDCRKDFSVKTGTLMHSSPMGLQIWGIAIYLLATSLKSVSSMKLHRDLGITQKSAWYLAQRIRETWQDNTVPFTGPVEVDETYIGGKRRNMPKSKRKALKGARERRQSGGRGCEGSRHQSGKRLRCPRYRRQDVAGVRRGSCRARRQGLHRRSRCL